MQTIYEIPEARLDWFVKKISQLNRKATKLGCDPVVIKEVGNVTKNKGKRIYKCVVIEVYGEAPKFKDWTFIAAVQYIRTEKETETIIRSIAGESVPVSFREKGPVCDHCKHNRYRKDTYIVRYSNGEYKQVGRTCLKDFLGHTNPNSLAFMAEFLLKVDDIAKESWHDSVSGGYAYYSLQNYLEAVSAIIKKVGWVSKKNSNGTRFMLYFIGCL